MKSVYSCLVDNNPKFQYQAWIWVNSLIKNADIMPENIFMHCIKGTDNEFKNTCSRLGVNIHDVEPFGDGKYCNKLSQLFNLALHDADLIILMDTDTFIVENFENQLDTDKICAKPVDTHTPDTVTFEKLFLIAELQKKLDDTKSTTTCMPTYGANFNGGLYSIPAKFAGSLHSSWVKWVNWLLEYTKNSEETLFPAIHIDQIGFCMAVHENNFPVRELDPAFNFPLHQTEQQVTREPYMLHYHWLLDDVGLIEYSANPILNDAILKANEAIKEIFNNSIYWNWRYETNPELGSGTGSRGEGLQIKRDILRILNIEGFSSVLDIGHGDLELMKEFTIKDYQGFDISNMAIRIAREKRPEWKFSHIDDISLIQNESFEYVQCLDVLIHQKCKESYDTLLELIISKTKKRLLVSGFTVLEDEYIGNHVLGFFGSLKDRLVESGKFECVTYLTTIGCADYYVCDVTLSTNPSKPPIPNDMSYNALLNAFKLTEYPNQLISTVACSRLYFGWYTKHFPRIYEYPWLLATLKNPDGKKIGDLGAGVTPIPILLAQAGAEVVTIDNSTHIRSPQQLIGVNEWGFLDYSVFDEKIYSQNILLTSDTFEANTFDCWYSISVIEHTPASVRRDLLKVLARLIKADGELFLTLDLYKGSEQLWNYCGGEVVESKRIHGTLGDIKKELITLGFDIKKERVIVTPKEEKIDTALIYAVKSSKENMKSKVKFRTRNWLHRLFGT